MTKVCNHKSAGVDKFKTASAIFISVKCDKCIKDNHTSYLESADHSSGCKTMYIAVHRAVLIIIFSFYGFFF